MASTKAAHKSQGHALKYNEFYDADACLTCDMWLGGCSNAGPPECYCHCAIRPDNPSLDHFYNMERDIDEWNRSNGKQAESRYFFDKIDWIISPPIGYKE